MWDGCFAKNEAGAQIDRECVIPFVERDVDDLGNALSVACVRHQDVWTVAMVLFNLLEQLLYIISRRHVNFVEGKLLGGVGRGGFELGDQRFDSIFVLRVGKSEVAAILVEVASNCAAYAVQVVSISPYGSWWGYPTLPMHL